MTLAKLDVWCRAAVAATLVLVSAQAAAKATATVTVSGFRYELIDLRPGDGVAPSITLAGDSGTFTYASVSTRSATVIDSFSAPTFLTDQRSTVSLQGIGLASGEILAGVGIVMASVSGPGGDQSGGAISDLQVYRSYTLSPWTALTISLSFAMSASVDGGPRFELALGLLDLSIQVYRPDGHELHSAYRQAVACTLSSCGGVPEREGTVSVSFANLSDQSFAGTMGFYVSADTQSAAPIPEPSAFALMLAGLAGVGAVARRRRARAG